MFSIGLRSGQYEDHSVQSTRLCLKVILLSLGSFPKNFNTTYFNKYKNQIFINKYKAIKIIQNLF